MSEYVVDFGDKSSAFVGLAMAEAESHGATLKERIVRCRDCEHGHITIDGRSCKWCDFIATHDPEGNEPHNGYDPEPYFDADFFCAWGVRKVDA